MIFMETDMTKEEKITLLMFKIEEYRIDLKHDFLHKTEYANTTHKEIFDMLNEYINQ